MKERFNSTDQSDQNWREDFQVAAKYVGLAELPTEFEWMLMKMRIPRTLWWWAADHTFRASGRADHALTHGERSSTTSSLFLFALGGRFHGVVVFTPLPVLKLGLFGWKSGITSALPTSGSVDALILTLQLTAVALAQLGTSNLQSNDNKWQFLRYFNALWINWGTLGNSLGLQTVGSYFYLSLILYEGVFFFVFFCFFF